MVDRMFQKGKTEWGKLPGSGNKATSLKRYQVELLTIGGKKKGSLQGGAGEARTVDKPVGFCLLATKGVAAGETL